MKVTLKIMIVLGVLFLNSYLFGQAPEGINYQAIVRDASGNLMINQNVDVIFNINQSTLGGVTVYSESQSLTTNAYGGFSTIIGQGTATSGTFETIEWGANYFFLNVNVDGNDLGTSQLMSVPYALHAKTAESVTNPIWKTKSSNGDYYTVGESVIIGDSNANANTLTVRNSSVISGFGEMVDFISDTLSANSDILNLKTGDETPDNAQFIECRRGNQTQFLINTDGSVYSKKEIKTDSSLIVADEVNRISTGDANLIPIAYGSVSPSGSVYSGTGNFTVSKTGVGEYTLSIVGESFTYLDYTVVVSLVGSSGFIFSSSLSGDMKVYTKDVSAISDDKRFNFVVYKN